MATVGLGVEDEGQGDDGPRTVAEPVELVDDCCSPVVVVVGLMVVLEGVAVARALVVVVGDGSLVGRDREAVGCGVPQPAARQTMTAALGRRARQRVNRKTSLPQGTAVQ